MFTATLTAPPPPADTDTDTDDRDLDAALDALGNRVVSSLRRYRRGCASARDELLVRRLVARAADRLDRAHPDWFRDVDPTTLVMESCDRCVLGQLYGHFVAGYGALFGGRTSVDVLAFSWSAPAELWASHVRTRRARAAVAV